MKIQIKYFSEDIDKIKKIENGDWIDLRASEDVKLKKGEFRLIPLGIGMILPDGYEAHIVPRSSTFKNYGLILTNSVGQIDNTYRGDSDEWKAMFYALKDGSISYNERIAQFDITPVYLKDHELIEVERLDNKNRGGYGTTGVK